MGAQNFNFALKYFQILDLTPNFALLDANFWTKQISDTTDKMLRELSYLVSCDLYIIPIGLGLLRSLNLKKCSNCKQLVYMCKLVEFVQSSLTSLTRFAHVNAQLQTFIGRLLQWRIQKFEIGGGRAGSRIWGGGFPCPENF